MSTGASDWLGLAGKTAVVTGSASGIGKAIALSLAEVGCSVALLDKDAKAVEAAAAELVAKGHKAVGFACDTSDKAGVEDIAFQVTKALGDVTVVVNNAGILRPGPLDTIGIDQWNAVLSVNLTGYLIVSQAFLPGMKAKGGGAIVHIASIAGSNAQQNSGAYSPAKAGVVMLSRTMAAEFGKFGVRSNVVSPGLIRTPLSEAFYQAPGVAEARAKMVPIGRVGGPQDVADTVVYLCSKRASYVSGAEILCDGGLDNTLMQLIPRPGYE